MSKIWKNKKRVACLLAAIALLLTGTITTMLQTSKDKGIDASAVGWQTDGLYKYSETYAYIIDRNYMVITDGKGYMTNASVGPYEWDGVRAIYVSGNFYTADTTSNNMPSNPVHYMNRVVGPYVDGKGEERRVFECDLPGYVELYFPNAAIKVDDNTRRGVTMTISNIKVAIRNGAKSASHVKLMNNHALTARCNTGGKNTTVGVSYDIRIEVDGAAQNENVLNLFRDLDQPMIIRNDTDNLWGYDINGCWGLNAYQEGVRPGSGCYDAHVNKGNIVAFEYGNTVDLVGKCANDDNGSDDNAVAFVGNATNYNFRWAGQNCDTTMGINLNDGNIPKTTATTFVTYEKLDGWSNWAGTDTWDVADTKTAFKGWTYTYTYPNDFSNHAVYENPTSCNVDGTKEIGLTSRSFGYGMHESHNFHIYVPRRSWTYRFNFDTYCPDGHTSSQISNKQGDITKKAESWSGSVSTPSLTGYTFLGFFDSSGNVYTNEQMYSNKTFYAKWRKNKYYVEYLPNGSTNFNHQTGEYVQNKTNGTMEKSTYEYDTEGTLRKNAFTREGYEFTGWNTEADGSGTARSDENRVYNWTTEDEATITLYAQWRKKLGNETITVVSEETGNPVSNVTMKLQKQVQGNWVDMGISATTSSAGQIKVSNLHWFNYRWIMTSVPAGYYKNTETPASCYTNYPSTDFMIRPCGTCGKEVCDQFTVTNRVILYMKHVNITLSSVVDCIIKGEDAPAFMYHINGLDAAGVRHEYNVLVQTNGSSKAGGTRLVHDIFAGTYTVTQVPVSRYVPGTARNLANSTINGTNATVDVLNHESAAVQFPYTLTNHGWYYGVDSKNNRLRK